LRFVSIIGARPDFVQVGVLSKRLRARHEEITIHTGQHYDLEMSDVFFSELNLPHAEINLGVGSKDASSQTGEMLAAIGAALREIEPDAVLVRGDTNGSLAGAIAAKQGLYALVHIEAGCRSFDQTMPEENNRIVEDHLADFNLTTDAEIAKNLAAEGLTKNVFVTGDVMYDTYVQAVSRLEEAPPAAPAFGGADYVLLTMHRSENVDDRARLGSILAGFAASPVRVLFPVHPRTRKRIEDFGLIVPDTVTPCDPLGYFDMVVAERAARTIFTDSGGVQREAYYGSVPCVTLRDNTEWTNTIGAGWNRLVGADSAAIASFLATPPGRPVDHPDLFGDGNATGKIIDVLESEAFSKLVEERRDARRRRSTHVSAQPARG
jgi:UDP-GlcNAc3NAcA epimerase